MDNKYNALECEKKWLQKWDEMKLYDFKRNNKEVFSIDTPPPTVSGNIHIGHIFSYTQTEFVARYKNLAGFNVFYPFGFDDNGLPTERLVEAKYGIKASEVGNVEFRKLCMETINEYEQNYVNLFKRYGISADLNNAYQTVSDSTAKISQRSFIELVNNNHAYHKSSPALWCNECSTSIAQAELETKTKETLFNHITFKTTDEESFVVATTRPELLGACVAIFVNEDNEATKHLIGKEAIVPIFNNTVKILCDDMVQVDKGSGIVMCCTFGDQTDIYWYKKHNLDLKHIFTKNGLIKDEVVKYGGMKINAARAAVIEDLDSLGLLVKQDTISHEVQVHERCGRPIEYTVIKQWFIDVLTKKEEFLNIGNSINWHPAHMQSRYNEWVKNLMWDWCISRQRYFGINFPVWYCKDCGSIKLAEINDLPVNPIIDMPKTACTCGSTSFIPETDVMDTWATSSITPLINMKYGSDTNFEDILKPMGVRSNASEIIRTWDFYSIVKSYYHFNEKPWENVMISGFVMADKGQKISKSKNNSKIEPLELVDKFGADVVRYWASSGRLGTDIVYSEETIKRGQKLVNKLFNVSKFVYMHLEDFDINETSIEFLPVDKWIIAKFVEMKKLFDKYMDEFEVGLALATLEKFFYNMCDNYTEIVKFRLYRPEIFGVEKRKMGQKTMYLLHRELIKMFSIYFPFITEEIYTNYYKDEVSVHKTTFIDVNFDFDYENIIKYGDMLIDIVSDVRGFKTKNSVSLKTEIEYLDITLNKELFEFVRNSKLDITQSLNIINLNPTTDNIDTYKINDIKLNIEEK